MVLNKDKMDAEDTTFSPEEAKLGAAVDIAKWVMGCLLVIVIVAGLLACFPSGWGISTTEKFIDSISSFFSPIVMVVLGYFLGKNSV